MVLILLPGMPDSQCKLVHIGIYTLLTLMKQKQNIFSCMHVECKNTCIQSWTKVSYHFRMQSRLYNQKSMYDQNKNTRTKGRNIKWTKDKLFIEAKLLTNKEINKQTERWKYKTQRESLQNSLIFEDNIKVKTEKLKHAPKTETNNEYFIKFYV